MFSVRLDLKKFQVSKANIQAAEFFFEEVNCHPANPKFPTINEPQVSF